MFYSLFHLEDGIFNLVRYITFRSICAVLTSLLISFLIGGHFIKFLKRIQGQGQPIREDGPESHKETKKGTPTMGGALILFSLCISTFLWGRLDNVYLWILLGVTVGYGLIGAYDDYLKLTRQTHHGLSGKKKILLQSLIALVAIYGCVELSPPSLAGHLAFPFVKDYLWNLGWFFFPFALCVIIGSSNAVNLTDGLDGLAIVPVMIALGCFSLIAYLVGNHVFASYLQLHHIPKVGEIAVFCGSFIGAGLGFLWFNAPPARIFMGDTGSLAAGGALGMMAVMTKHEIVLAIIGGLFVFEAVSVILQVGSFKMRGKRVFLMAPIHHHYEKKGWSEPTIVIRFWIIATVLALVGLSTLKLR